MSQLPDQRTAQRQTQAEAFLIEAHAERIKNLEAGMDVMVANSLGREYAEEMREQAQGQ